MKWIQVKETEQKMDTKGYMVFQDVSKWQEVEDVKTNKRAVAKSAGVKSDGTVPQVLGAKKAANGNTAQKKGGPKVQSALGSFFSVKRK